ncbi:MAG: porin family protein [Gammaproteobacteria bacterium]|nr:porin family protein [Gammaproteobacteria bacterium]MYF29839.1 porin family protein [Gammaproteobacteria bacterium]MYK45308.1 porin family protein [Gammaproteobacteria bacterium]
MDVRYPALGVILLVANMPLAADRQPDGATKKWSVSVYEATFHAYGGVRAMDVLPDGADGYTESLSLLTPNVGVGYALNERWSVDTNVQMGPRSSFAPTVAGLEGFPRIEFKSTFLSVMAAREYKLPEGWSLAPKLGVAVSSRYYEEDKHEARSTDWTSSLEPVASVELRKRITDSLSLSTDYTRYFTDDSEINGAFKVGLRFRF